MERRIMKRKWCEQVCIQAANRRAAALSETVGVFWTSARDGVQWPTYAPATSCWKKNFQCEQTPYGSIRLENLVVAQLFRKLPAF
jgi:hypothetical protein